MCGIFGVINGTNQYQNKLLAYANNSRGSDSCGFLEPSNNNRIRFLGSVIDVIENRRLPDKFWGSPVFVGHTRNASPGSPVTKQNAHPFRSGSIVGAHNGFIRNFKDLKDLYSKEDSKINEMQVDSEIIFWLLDKKGIDSLSEVSGKAALWWTDERDPGKLFLWCWNQTLYVHTQDNGPLAFSSDPAHLRVAGFGNPKQVKDNGQVCYIDIKNPKWPTLIKIVAGRELPKTEYNSSGFSCDDNEFGYMYDGTQWTLSKKRLKNTGNIKPPAAKEQSEYGDINLYSVMSAACGMHDEYTHQRKVLACALIGGVIYECDTCHDLLPSTEPSWMPGGGRSCRACAGIVLPVTESTMTEIYDLARVCIDEFTGTVGKYVSEAEFISFISKGYKQQTTLV